MKKEPGEIGEDFRGDRREPVVGHVEPPKDRALGLFCGDTQKASVKKSHLRDLRLARARGREVRRLPERSMLSILVGGGKIVY